MMFYILQLLAVFGVYLLRLITMSKFQLIVFSLIVSTFLCLLCDMLTIGNRSALFSM